MPAGPTGRVDGDHHRAIAVAEVWVGGRGEVMSGAVGDVPVPSKIGVCLQIVDQFDACSGALGIGVGEALGQNVGVAMETGGVSWGEGAGEDCGRSCGQDGCERDLHGCKTGLEETLDVCGDACKLVDFA